MPSLNILIVDNDPLEVDLISRMLKDNYKGNFVLRRAESLEKADAILKTQRTDVVLLDCETIDNQNPNDLILALSAIDKLAPTILISNEIDFSYLKENVLLDVYDIVDKFNLRKRIANDLLTGL